MLICTSFALLNTGYTEYIEEQLSEALYSCLALYNKATSMRIELVFFREAVQHAARLSRVLVSTDFTYTYTYTHSHTHKHVCVCVCVFVCVTL